MNASSRAAGVGIQGENVSFGVSVTVKKRRIYIIGTPDPALTSVVAEVPVQVFSGDDVGSRTGFGFMLHRLAKKVFEGNKGVETFMIPQAEAGAAVAAAGSVAFTPSGTVTAGTLNLRIGGFTLVQVSVTAGMTGAQIATALVAAINALRTKDGCPVMAVVDGTDTTKVNFTSKSKGTWGNRISLTLNTQYGEAESAPGNLTATIVAMSGGSGTPTLTNALIALGSGDNQNAGDGTVIVHGYGQATTPLDNLSVYNGIGLSKLGNYSSMVHKPFYSLTGNVDPGSAGLSTLTSFTNGRKLDRTNGVVVADGSPCMPDEIAALAVGIIEGMAATRPEENYVDIPLPGVIPGAQADRWSDEYNNRDAAVQAGISPTYVKNGIVTLQNVMSFHRPDSVPVESNAYASIRSIVLVQNVLENVYKELNKSDWKGISIVKDKAQVSNALSKLKVKDIQDVKDALLALNAQMVGMGWLYSDEMLIKYMRENPDNVVQIRANMSGFDMVFPLIFSIEGGILNAAVQYDTSIAAVRTAA